MKIKPVTDFNKLLTVDEVVLGGVLPANGNSREYVTGNWRTQRPIYHRDRCIDCMFCWISCPDSAIIVKDAVIQGMNHDHCKGCGICEYICPVNPKAIEMAEGGEY
jgi:pyruvate ferredoxin oxidoreductase delta subunit